MIFYNNVSEIDLIESRYENSLLEVVNGILKEYGGAKNFIKQTATGTFHGSEKLAIYRHPVDNFLSISIVLRCSIPDYRDKPFLHNFEDYLYVYVETDNDGFTNYDLLVGYDDLKDESFSDEHVLEVFHKIVDLILNRIYNRD